MASPFRVEATSKNSNNGNILFLCRKGDIAAHPVLRAFHSCILPPKSKVCRTLCAFVCVYTVLHILSVWVGTILCHCLLVFIRDFHHKCPANVTPLPAFYPHELQHHDKRKSKERIPEIENCCCCCCFYHIDQSEITLMYW